MRKVPLSKKQKRAEKIKKTLIHVGIWLLGLLIVIALGVFAVRGFGIKTVIIPVLGRRGDRKKLPCRLYRQRPYGKRGCRSHDKLCNDTQ